jgi:hypothetical protein
VNEDRAFQVLANFGIPRERARTVENGIMVLDQRYRREIDGLESRIRDFEATRWHHKGCICAACERLGFANDRGENDG